MDSIPKDPKVTPNPEVIPTPPKNWFDFADAPLMDFQASLNELRPDYGGFRTSLSSGDRNNNNDNNGFFNNFSTSNIPLYRSHTIASPMKWSSAQDYFDLGLTSSGESFAFQPMQSTTSSSPLSPTTGSFPPFNILNEIDVPNSFGSNGITKFPPGSFLPSVDNSGLFGDEDSTRRRQIELQFEKQKKSLEDQRLKNVLKEERVPWSERANRAPAPSSAAAGSESSNNLKSARSLTDISSQVCGTNGIGAPQSKKWSSIVSCNTPAQPQVSSFSSAASSQPKIQPKALKRAAKEADTEEMRKLDELDIYMPKTVWLMVRYGSKKFTKADVKKFIASLCKGYSLLPEEFYLYYQEFKKPDHFVAQMSTKNYEKLNGQCSATDPKIKIGAQEHPFRRISPIIQCFLCFSFEHYNSNCNVSCKRCEQCSENYKPGHTCSQAKCCNCRALNKPFGHSPKSLFCPIVFEKCQQIAERIVYLD